MGFAYWAHLRTRAKLDHRTVVAAVDAVDADDAGDAHSVAATAVAATAAVGPSSKTYHHQCK